jgi:transposase InsO family protein
MQSPWTWARTSSPPPTKLLELAVFDYIETFYNPRRPHSSLSQNSPEAFEVKNSKSNIKAA